VAQVQQVLSAKLVQEALQDLLDKLEKEEDLV